jgi:hypothetical protein
MTSKTLIDAHTLFPSNNDVSGWTSTFESLWLYNQMVVHLPDSFRTHGEKMNFHLCTWYEQAESGDSIDESVFNGTIHDLFINVFTKLRASPLSEQAVVATFQSKSRECGGR